MFGTDSESLPPHVSRLICAAVKLGLNRYRSGTVEDLGDRDLLRAP